ncbi:MAG: hypothetical protein NHB14_00310 [Desulfosporosinus sp.]|nr:hypothetical protein [Desulfosporosinus sp.]
MIADTEPQEIHWQGAMEARLTALYIAVENTNDSQAVRELWKEIEPIRNMIGTIKEESLLTNKLIEILMQKGA